MGFCEVETMQMQSYVQTVDNVYYVLYIVYSMCPHHFFLDPHAVPERLDPLPTQDTEYHHEGVEEVTEVPSVQQWNATTG